MTLLARIPESRLAHIEAGRICIIKPSAMGDIVQTLPVLSALRTRFPRAAISWVVKPQWAALLRGHPDIAEVMAVDFREGLSNLTASLVGLHRRRFDLVFDLQGLFRSSLMTWATRAPYRIGLQAARECANWACNCVLSGTGRNVAAHARYWRVAEAIGAGEVTRRGTIAVDPDDEQWARRRLHDARGLKVGFHLGAAWPSKQWPVDKFLAVAQRLLAEMPATLFMVGGPSDRRQSECLESALRRSGQGDNVRNLAGQSSLKQLAALLAQLDVVVSNDSGPMHLAAAVGTPVVGIFTCTSPDRSGPPAEAHELVSTRVPCRASYRKRCPYRPPRFQCCHAELDEQRVWQALLRLLQKHGLQRFAA